MTLRCREPLALKFDGRVIQFEPGSCFRVSANQAQRILAQFPHKVEVLTLPPDPPIEPLQLNWLVAYRDRSGTLRGGSDDRLNGTVQECRWIGGRWSVQLVNGETIPLSIVSSVATIDGDGRVLAAWTVREHGYDGEGPVTRGGQR